MTEHNAPPVRLEEDTCHDGVHALSFAASRVWLELRLPADPKNDTPLHHHIRVVVEHSAAQADVGAFPRKLLPSLSPVWRFDINSPHGYFKQAHDALKAHLRNVWVPWALDRMRMDNEPIPMVLHCPTCHQQHVDAPGPGWDNPPHSTHLCSGCGGLFRPSHRRTVGVAVLPAKDA